MSTDNKSGEREAVAWRWRPVDSKYWIYDPSQAWLEDYASDPQVVLEPLFSLSQLEAVERERDMLNLTVERCRKDASAAEAQVTSLQQQVAELKGALERVLSVIPDEIYCGRRCVIEAEAEDEAEYAAALNAARSTLTREAPNE